MKSFAVAVYYLRMTQTMHEDVISCYKTALHYSDQYLLQTTSMFDAVLKCCYAHNVHVDVPMLTQQLCQDKDKDIRE